MSMTSRDGATTTGGGGADAPAITVEGLRKSYGDLEAVRGISFEVHRGEVFALLGPNGAGKTTTLEVLEGFRERTAGEVRVLGIDPTGQPLALRSRVGIVLQDTGSEAYLTVREVLQRTAGYYAAPRGVAEVIALVGLEEKTDARVKSLSGGQRRRLDVALGIVGRPELVFLDEPTTGFDPSARRESWDLVRNLTGTGTTVILTTHYMDEAQTLANRLAIIAAGRIVAEGTPESLGGRDTAAAHISFQLPEGVSVADLTVTPTDVSAAGLVTVTTEDELRVLHQLTGWALDTGHELAGLRVDRPSLEDVYLELTRTAEEASA
ncbi:ABC transporter ATP-binding protein [Acidothermaceae bacterium B102]|nr:ABC transporter ATP-binding protein [Acidothermaceae bacterium B102]